MTRVVPAEGYGGPEVLALQDIELPPVGDGEVLVDVRAAGTNPIDYKLYGGDMGRDPAKLPMPVGMEAAGVGDEASEAHRYLQTGHARGKVVPVP